MLAPLRLCALAMVVVVAGTGCPREGGAASSRAPSDDGERALVVFAAASLREAFTALGDAFEAAHPGVEVRLQLAGSQDLRTQIEHGAAADVFASADLVPMEDLQRRGRVEEPVIFARNEPVIVVATRGSERAARIQRLADLPQAERLVVGAASVPIGRYSLTILENAERALGAAFRADVDARIVSGELNVRQVLAKVVLGEADAGIVYRTDAKAAEGTVRVVDIEPELNVVARYPIAVVEGAPETALAKRFVDLVTSPEGVRVLEGAGFKAEAPRVRARAPATESP